MRVALARSDDDNINSNAATLLCQMVLAEAADGGQPALRDPGVPETEHAEGVASPPPASAT